MSNKDITAVVTHYNIPKELFVKCMDSLEKYGINAIIVDDASDYEFRKNLEPYPNVIQLNENVGPYKAFLVGLNNVTTKYVMKVDADDYIIGVPDISTGEDAYINNIDGKISLDPVKFRRFPYAGMNGATVKTSIMKDIWRPTEGFMHDVVIFHRLLLKYKPVFNPKSLYEYVKGREGSITYNIAKNRMQRKLRKKRRKEMEMEADEFYRKREKDNNKISRQ